MAFTPSKEAIREANAHIGRLSAQVGELEGQLQTAQRARDAEAAATAALIQGESAQRKMHREKHSAPRPRDFHFGWRARDFVTIACSRAADMQSKHAAELERLKVALVALNKVRALPCRPGDAAQEVAGRDGTIRQLQSRLSQIGALAQQPLAS